MTRFAVALLAIGLVTSLAYAGKKCTGAEGCTACKNCSGCAHCGKGGGTCGVCKPTTRPTE